MDKKEFKNKDKLLDAALDEFCNYSYRQASLNRIIKKAGISKGSFYFHFKNKKSLYLYLFKEVGKRKISFFNEHTAEYKEAETNDIFELIKIQAQMGLKFSLKYPGYYKLWLRFWKEEDKKIQEMVIDRFKDEIDNAIRLPVRELREKGHFRDDFDEDLIVRIITHFLINFNEIFPIDTGRVKDGSYLNDINKYIDFLKNGLLKRRKDDNK